MEPATADWSKLKPSNNRLDRISCLWVGGSLVEIVAVVRRAQHEVRTLVACRSARWSDTTAADDAVSDTTAAAYHALVHRRVSSQANCPHRPRASRTDQMLGWASASTPHRCPATNRSRRVAQPSTKATVRSSCTSQRERCTAAVSASIRGCLSERPNSRASRCWYRTSSLELRSRAAFAHSEFCSWRLPSAEECLGFRQECLRQRCDVTAFQCKPHLALLRSGGRRVCNHLLHLPTQ